MHHKPPNAHQRALRFRSSVCHITGLPYTAAPPKNSGTYPWSDNSEIKLEGEIGTNKIKWNSDGVHLEGNSKVSRLTSPEFHVPSAFGVNLTVPVKFYSVCGMWIPAQPQLICRISGTEVINRTGAKAPSGIATNKTENYTGEATGNLNTSKKTIEIENAYTKSTAYVYVYSVTLKYN